MEEEEELVEEVEEVVEVEEEEMEDSCLLLLLVLDSWRLAEEVEEKEVRERRTFLGEAGEGVR